MPVTNPFLTAAALRGRQQPTIQYPTGGGTVGRSISDSLAMAPRQQAQPTQQVETPNFAQMKQNAEMMRGATDKIGTWWNGGGGADIGAASQQYGPEVAKMGGNVTAPSGWGSTFSNLFGGSGVGGAGGASGAGSAGAGAGGFSSFGPAALAAVAAFLTDKEMNENKGSIINANKLNKSTTFGNSGIGLRLGDAINGLNGATWFSDPSKAAKGLANAMTMGVFDKIF